MTRQLKQEEATAPAAGAAKPAAAAATAAKPAAKNKVLHLLYRPVSTDAGFLLAITDI